MLKILSATVSMLMLASSLLAQTITGAGATFPYPIYSKWFDVYAKSTGVQINYQSIGSGGGIRQYMENTVDFAATDGPMSQDQMALIGGKVLHIPTVLGAVVLTYNVPEITVPLKFDGKLIADIYFGNIKKWNDPRIQKLNPGVKLPAVDLIPVYRADGSGTTFIFTDYLSKVSVDWKEKIGSATSVKWPTGLGAKGNEGVSQQVKLVDGSVGYVELIYATSNKMAYAWVQNSAGKFIEPSLTTVTAAASSAKFSKNTDFRVSITNAPGDQSYPISSFTWLLIRPVHKDAAKGKIITNFLEWMISTEAQSIATTLGYAQLPQPVIVLIRDRIMILKK